MFIRILTRLYISKINFLPSGVKAIPLQALTGPEGSRRLGSQISRQSAHEGGKVVSPTHWLPLPPLNIPGTHFCERLSRPRAIERPEVLCQ
jgi:hypothetical protein